MFKGGRLNAKDDIVCEFVRGGVRYVEWGNKDGVMEMETL